LFGNYRLTSLASSVIPPRRPQGGAKGGGRTDVNLGLTHPKAISGYMILADLWDQMEFEG
jgi:hypothetical protein